jgi:hypothetical protein
LDFEAFGMKKSLMKGIYFSLLCMLIGVYAKGQQLDQIGKKGGLKLNGGVNVNQVYRTNSGMGTDPYSMVVSGQLGLSVYGLSVPLSFTWSNSKFTATQPFNQFALSPTYKWATLHMGWSSMSFSPYSLSGHTFAGAGIELRPSDKFTFTGFYGRLRKELKRDTVLGVDPQYKRMGTGFKTSYKLKQGEVGVHMLYAADDTSYASGKIDSLGVTPMENMVIGTFFVLRPTQALSIQSEISNSSISTDRRISRASDLNGQATNNHWALKTNVAMNFFFGSLGAGIEYVEPGYTTLGAYYTLNDFVNYTLNLSTVLLKGKVNLAADLGIRENNLSKESDTDQKDVIQNINVNFTPSEKLNFNLSYSNFYNYTHIQTIFEEENAHTQYELLDTLTFTQINQSVNLATNWKIKDTEQSRQNINCNLNFQKSSQEQSDTPENADTQFINASLGYMWSLPEKKLSLGLNSNYSRNESPENTMEAMGPVFSMRKSFFEKKMRSRISLSWNGTYQDGKSTGNVITSRLGTNYTLKKKHQFNFNLAYTHRKRRGNTNSYVTASLGYSYRFSVPKSVDKSGKQSD